MFVCFKTYFSVEYMMIGKTKLINGNQINYLKTDKYDQLIKKYKFIKLYLKDSLYSIYHQLGKIFSDRETSS